MNEKIGDFIAKMMVHFPFRHESPQAEAEWITSMARNLGGYSPKILELTAQEFIDRRTDRRFPMIAEVRKQADEIARREKHASPQLDLEPDRSKSYDWQYKLADELIDCDLGRRACQEGWQLSLHDFIRRERRLPASGEIQGIKQASKGFDAAYRVCIEGNGGVANASLVKLGDMMLARRESLRSRLLGDSP